MTEAVPVPDHEGDLAPGESAKGRRSRGRDTACAPLPKAKGPLGVRGVGPGFGVFMGGQVMGSYQISTTDRTHARTGDVGSGAPDRVQ